MRATHPRFRRTIIGLLLGALVACGAAAACVLEHLESGRSRFVSSRAPAEVDRAILNGRAVAQMSQVNAGTRRREATMAENVAWILDQAPPGSKLVLWADNLRVARGVSLGAHLASRYGRRMVVLGFAFHEGRYDAVAEGDRPGANDAKPSAPGSPLAIVRRIPSIGMALAVVVQFKRRYLHDQREVVVERKRCGGVITPGGGCP